MEPENADERALYSREINPVAVEEAIRECSRRIANGVIECDKRYRRFLEADREYDRAYAKAYLSHDGPAHEKRYSAELATSSERDDRDVADAAYRFADRQAKALAAELSAWQSVNRSVIGMWGAAGIAER